MAEDKKKTTGIAEGTVTPKRRGRPKKTSQAQPVTTDVAIPVKDTIEPTKVAVDTSATPVSETSTASFGDDDEVNDINLHASEPAIVASGATEPVLSDSKKRHYPTISERLAAVDANIARLTQLNESRVALVAKTQASLEERRAALEKSMKALKTTQEKKDRLIEIQNRPSKPPVVKAPKLSPEARAAARLAALEHARATRKAKKEAKMAEEAKIRELVEKLRASGRSVDELLESFASHEKE